MAAQKGIIITLERIQDRTNLDHGNQTLVEYLVLTIHLFTIGTAYELAN